MLTALAVEVDYYRDRSAGGQWLQSSLGESSEGSQYEDHRRLRTTHESCENDRNIESDSITETFQRQRSPQFHTHPIREGCGRSPSHPSLPESIQAQKRDHNNVEQREKNKRTSVGTQGKSNSQAQLFACFSVRNSHIYAAFA